MAVNQLNNSVSQHNFKALIWHASFLAIAKNFMDVDTVIPSMLIDAGGTPFLVGLLITIMVGFSKFAQLLFAPFISRFNVKKPLLLGAISLRILSLMGMALLFFIFTYLSSIVVIWSIFILVFIFSISGAFANIPFIDILGKSIKEENRKQFFSLRQVVSSFGMLISAAAVGFVLKFADWPINYIYVFGFASIFLLIASLGFWQLKEVVPNKIQSVKYSFANLWYETRNNSRLTFYLISINVMGLGQGLLPFVLLYSSYNKIQVNGFVGYLLIAKTLGLVVSGLALYKRAHVVSYRNMLRIMWLLSMVFPLTAWIWPYNPWMYYLTFFLGGVFLTFYTVSTNGVLLEISNNANRTIYTGITGAGNLLPVLFPLIGGGLIAVIGFDWFYFIYLVLVCTGLWFLYKMNCKK